MVQSQSCENTRILRRTGKVLVVSVLVALSLLVLGWRMFDRLLGSPTAAYRAYRCASQYMELLRLRDYEGVVKLSSTDVRVYFTGRADALRHQFPEVASYSLTRMRGDVVRGRGSYYSVQFRFTPIWGKEDRLGFSIHEEAGRCVVTPDSG